ncbi:MAG: glycosyltransferase [Clostridiales bacterium]|nr:glycosyltransferase [Clostridiales bacterium]
MNNNKISIIIPAYNSAKFIENTINSVLQQTYKNFEIIVVNDGSSDNTLEVLENLRNRDNRIIIISQKNSGVSAARNTGLLNATGEFITFVDSDDSLPKNALETLVDKMKDDVDFVIGSHNEVKLTKKPHLETPSQYNKKTIKDNFREFDRVIWWPWGKLFRKSIIEKNNLSYDTSISYGEDHIFNLLYSKYINNKIVVTDKIVYNYYFFRGGLCSKYYPDMHKMQKYVYLKIADYFGSVEETPKKYHKLYVGSYLKGCIEYYIAWLSFNDAIQKVKESFVVYDDLLDDEILKEYFTKEQFDLIKNNDIRGFVKNYIKSNPKATVWRKFRRTVRKFFERTQISFTK